MSKDLNRYFTLGARCGCVFGCTGCVGGAVKWKVVHHGRKRDILVLGEGNFVWVFTAMQVTVFLIC